MMIIYTSGTTGKPKNALHSHFGFPIKQRNTPGMAWIFPPSKIRRRSRRSSARREDERFCIDCRGPRALNVHMNKYVSLFSIILIGLAAPSVFAADTLSFAGEFTDKNFMKSKAVFQLSVEQKGNDVSVFFSAGHVDGHGAAPEADGRGKATGKNTLEFKWEDSFKNSGTGTIKREGNGVILSLNPTHVEEPRCLQFYRQNMKLEPAAGGKKLGAHER
jgi:hypothetical protein